MSTRVRRINVSEVNTTETNEYIPSDIGKSTDPIGQTFNRVGDRKDASRAQKIGSGVVAAALGLSALVGLAFNKSGNTDNGIPLDESSTVRVGDNEIPRADYDELVRTGVIVVEEPSVIANESALHEGGRVVQPGASE